jgi:pimeloyl-ACP methyl ester carboxylesterase
MMTLYAHGLEGRPDGRKATALRDAGFEVTAPDGRRKPLAQRIEGLEAALSSLDRPLLLGSSYGGLAALWLASRHAGQLQGVILCAPALVWSEPPVTDPGALIIPTTLPCTVIHGTRDAVIPVQVSRDLAARCPHVRLLEPDDDHMLSGSLPLIIEAARTLSR